MIILRLSSDFIQSHETGRHQQYSNGSLVLFPPLGDQGLAKSRSSRSRDLDFVCLHKYVNTGSRDITTTFDQTSDSLFGFMAVAATAVGKLRDTYRYRGRKGGTITSLLFRDIWVNVYVMACQRT